MKQMGLNVASDPIMCVNYIGVKGGMVIYVAGSTSTDATTGTSTTYGATMNIYGGTIIGGNIGTSGNVAVKSGGVLNMYGGTIVGGKANKGGALYVSGKVTIYGGTIQGGTSVNTIAQHAEMLYEFRSDCRESLEIMEKHLAAAIEFYRTKGVSVTVTNVGDRPCSGDVDEEKMNELCERAAAATRRYYGCEMTCESGSTDCNIPLSLGVPAICVGCYDGAVAHTRVEYVIADSLPTGLKFGFDMVLYYFQA